MLYTKESFFVPFCFWVLKMVHYHRYHVVGKKGGDVLEKDEESQNFLLVWANSSGYYCRRKKPKLVSFLLLSLLCCTILLAPVLFFSLVHRYSFGLADMAVDPPLCSSVSNGTICCDRSHLRFDTCIMKGDVRTHSTSSSIFLYSSVEGDDDDDSASSVSHEGLEEVQHEKIRPYTRKWETSVMNTIDELDLVVKKEKSGINHRCDVNHDVPAVVFSTGGYTGNVYHEFNDGIIPLFITSQHFNKKVVFLILEYHDWWIMKYGDILSHLSDYPAIDFSGDNRTHCFPEVIVGPRIHDELTVDSSLMFGNKSIVDFRNILDKAYWPRISSLIQDEERDEQEKMSVSPTESLKKVQVDHKRKQKAKPKLVILSRNGSRAITNENLLVQVAEKIGFQVEVLKPQKTSELAKIYRVLNSSDVMIGVHGAAMTHFLFMRPGTVFIQVIPLGTDWAAEAYYGEPARKLGLKYIGYKILPRESSLYDSYDENDPVLRDPSSVNDRGWDFTKKIYLEGQTVRLDLRRFRKHLVRAYDYHTITKQHFHLQSQ